MKELSLELIQKCINNKRRAKDCTRCKGSGLFRTIDKYDGLASSRGKECHGCSHLRKVPLSWTKMSIYNRADFFIKLYQAGQFDLALAHITLGELFEVEMLSCDDLNEIASIIDIYRSRA